MPPPDTSPPRRQAADGQVYLDTPAPPDLRAYAFTAVLSASYEGSFEERLADVLGGEPYEIVEHDPRSGRSVIRTTDWGGLALNGQRGALEVTDIAPRVDRIERHCTLVTARLPHPETTDAADAVFDAVSCPSATRLIRGESIVVEGQDDQGARLWVASVQDPRMRFWRTGVLGNPSLEEIGPFSVSIAIPLSDDLHRLRWWRYGDYGDLEGLGDTLWRTEPAPAGP